MTFFDAADGGGTSIFPTTTASFTQLDGSRNCAHAPLLTSVQYSSQQDPSQMVV